MTTREPNQHLERLYRETGWTLRQFVQAVNRIGTERGTPVQYREQSAHQWLKGYVPKESARPLVLEALARKLRRIITPSAAGFPERMGGPDEQATSSTIEGIIDLGSQDVSPSRRSVIGASLFSAALAIPDWPDIVGRMESAQSGGVSRIGMPDVSMVVKMTDRLSELDDQFGGRHARPMAAAFLVNTVAPYLRADAPEEVRRSMMSAAAFHCYLTGWMAVDEGLHGLAQRYYVKGLELAGASGDRMTYCHILRGMSGQAVDLGHGVTAARLANAAATASPSAEPRMKAFMAGQQAHSFAMAGERANALRSLQEAEKAMSKAESQAGTFGGYSTATLAYHDAQVRYELGDVPGSVTSLKMHFRLRDSTDSQVTALRFGSMLAERQLEMGHLEAACKTWDHVLDQYPSMNSDRVDRHVRSIAPLLSPYRANATARETWDRAGQAA
ncbi:tetratricopeptide repeat protein [Streptomyces uncialis]|uniref:tetratricopeptide repeat protein n=1 Tax=Streptomyces uncialis TaxID=1048205 RepID=UPI0038254C52